MSECRNLRVLIQRVASASVEVGGSVVGSIGQGLLLLVGVAHGDTTADVSALADKVATLRIFSDESGKMNHSLREVGGGALVVSQFTLLADTSRGRRPSFSRAAAPDVANELVEAFVEHLGAKGVAVETGVFGAKMKVSLVNDGPVTLVLDSVDGIGG